MKWRLQTVRGQLSKIVATAAACFLRACLVSAQAPASPTPTPTPADSPSPTAAPTRSFTGIDLPTAKAEVDRQRGMDATFMTRVQLRAAEELEQSRTVAARSANTAVRSFAQQMTDDLGKTIPELRRLAESQGVDLPAEPDAAGKAESERVSRLSSPELDRAYVERMLRSLDADAADFQAQARMAQEVELQAWVCDTLPHVEDAQTRIHAIAGEIGIPSRSGR
jgi:predicted outer membrane protein